jgi:hypothetical protein
MAMMMGHPYSALKQAGADEEIPKRAAEEVATYDARMNTIENRLSVLTWMVGTNVALTLAILGKLFLAGPQNRSWSL